MTSDGFNRFERLLDQTVRKVSGGSLHPLEILRTIEQVVAEQVQDAVAPNDVRIAMHPDDYRQFAPALERLREEVDALLDDLERRGNFARLGDRLIGFGTSANVPEGTVAVTAGFADTKNRVTSPPAGATRRLTRERDVLLLLEGGAAVQVTHTPFTIGRGPGNDLVLPSLAVSRDHAELVRSEYGFALIDLGSRNGLVVNGRRLERVELAPGMRVTVGDVELQLEMSQ
jgi:hypothetical protein